MPELPMVNPGRQDFFPLPAFRIQLKMDIVETVTAL